MTVLLSDIWSQGEADFTAGRYEDALRSYLTVVEGAPRFVRARYRIADALLNLGDRDRAKEVYQALAWHYIKAGHPLLGLVVCKMVLALDPEYEDLLHILAELYSSESDRVGDVDLPEPPPLPDGAPAPGVANISAPGLYETAAKAASDTEAITQVPPRFPQIPLFSHLSEDAFIRVLHSLRLRRFTNEQTIVTEGEPGDSFFMLADGIVVVSKRYAEKPVTLAHLHQGAVFGEMALVSNAPRAATVHARGDVDLLELRRSDLEQHAGELEGVKKALKRFTRGRFLANLAATSPLFKSLAKPDRRTLMAKFRPQTIYEGDVLIEEGEPGRGLYLALRGDYQVTTQKDGRAVELAILRGGDVFGEISLLNEAPTVATVTARSLGEVLFLPKEEFQQVVMRYPEVLSTLSQMTEDRLKERTSLTHDVPLTDDSAVML